MEMSHASRKSVQIAQSVSSGNSAADTLFSQGQRQNHDGSTGSATDPGYSSLRQDTVVSIRSQYDTTNRSLEVLASYFRIPRVGFNAELTNVEDQLGRLRIWAGNIGVNAKEHASLDYRLRDSREAREITVKLLKIVHDHAQQAISIRQTADAPSWQKSSNAEDIISDAQVASTMSSKFEGTDTESLAEMLELDPFDSQLREIELGIDRLFLLSQAIRAPAKLSPHEMGAKGVMRDEEGNENEMEFRHYAYEVLKHRFPDASELLHNRLASAITFRRRRFLYRSRHQTKLSRPYHGSSINLASIGASTDFGDRTTITVGRASQVKLTAAAGRRRTRAAGVAPSQLSRTSASEFKASHFDKKPIFDSKSGFATTVQHTPKHNSSVAVPDPPPVLAGSKEFECPYCCLMVPQETRSPTQWRRHVMLDLEPYVCTFDDCHNGDIPIKDFANWVHHMKETHTAQWSCTMRGHAAAYFVSEHDFEHHMRDAHKGVLTDDQLHAWTKNRRRTSNIVLSACPLCTFEPSEDELNRERELSSRSQIETDDAVIRSNFLLEHLAHHLESSSQLALPWQEDYTQLNASARAASSKVERSDVAETDLIVELAEDGVTESRDDGQEQLRAQLDRLWTQWVNETISQYGSDAADADVGSEDWSFLDEELEEYFGPDRDPVLQPFLQKFYLDHQSQALGMRGPRLPAYMVPVSPVDGFFGRSYALTAITEALVPNSSTETSPTTLPRTFAVHAPGGMGKTQVSAQFVHLNRDKFDAVFWVHADEQNKLAQGFKEIAIELGLVQEDSADARDLVFVRNVVKRWLINPIRRLQDIEKANPSKATWLLVFDGVEDPRVLNDYWPYDGPGSILISSRSPFSWTASLQLAPFTEREAIDFLLRLTQQEASEEQRLAVGKVNDQLGGLPLALAQMAGFIQHKNMTFAEFLESYNEQGQALHEAQTDLVTRASGYEHTLASVWAFENLAHGRPILNIVSMLDPDGIPEDLLMAPLSDQTLNGIFPSSWSEFRDARNELVACSLVSRNKEERKLSIHRLVQDVARTRMTPDGARHNFMICVRLIASTWPFEPFDWRHSVSKWTDCEPLFPHVSRLKLLYPYIKKPESFSEDEFNFARLLTDAGWYHHETGRSLDAKSFNSLAQDICLTLKRSLQDAVVTHEDRTNLKELDRVLAEIEHNRGCIATETNEPAEALSHHIKFNNLMKTELGQVQGGTDMRLAISWNELGCAYMLCRDWNQGAYCFRRSIALMQQLDDFKEISISLPVVNLGLASWLQGNIDEAKTLLENGLRQRELTYGAGDRVSFITGRYLHALGNVAASEGLLEESQDYHQRALLHHKYTLGSNHHRTADTFIKVAEHHLRRGDEIALPLIEAALKIYDSSNESTYKPEKARALYKRHHLLLAADDKEAAFKQLDECFKLYRIVFDEEAANLAEARRLGPFLSENAGKNLVKKQTSSELQAGDLDYLVAFWSR